MPRGDAEMGSVSSARPAPAAEAEGAETSSSEDPDFELGETAVHAKVLLYSPVSSFRAAPFPLTYHCIAKTLV